MVTRTIARANKDTIGRFRGHSSLNRTEERSRTSIAGTDRNPMVAGGNRNDHRPAPPCWVFDTIDPDYRAGT